MAVRLYAVFQQRVVGNFVYFPAVFGCVSLGRATEGISVLTEAVNVDFLSVHRRQVGHFLGYKVWGGLSFLSPELVTQLLGSWQGNLGS